MTNETDNKPWTLDEYFDYLTNPVHAVDAPVRDLDADMHIGEASTYMRHAEAETIAAWQHARTMADKMGGPMHGWQVPPQPIELAKLAVGLRLADELRRVGDQLVELASLPLGGDQ